MRTAQETNADLIRVSLEHTPAMVNDMQKPIHVAVGNLCLKAFATREDAFRSRNMNPPPTPTFISQLRQWREKAKAKQQMRIAKHNSSVDLARGDEGTLGINRYATYTPHPTMDVALPYPPNAVQPDAFGNNNQSSLNDSSDYGEAENPAIDFDFMLPDDYIMGNNSLDPINWEQWDSWLAESNAMPP